MQQTADLQKELNRLHLLTDIYEAPINVMLIRKNEFSDEPIRKWEFALLPGQTPIPLKSKEIYGYGVDAGLGLFVDQAAKNSLNTLLDENWNNMFSEKFEHYLNYSFQNQNAVFFSTGYGDGFYATYIGRDTEGKIVQLLTDFDIVLWRNVGE